MFSKGLFLQCVKSRPCVVKGFNYTIPTLNDPGTVAFENIVGKGENAGNQHFLFFPHFLPFPKQILIFNSQLFCCLQILSIRSSLKIVSVGKELKSKADIVPTGSVPTNHSQEHSLSFFFKICKFECNTTSDWLNHMV